MTKISSAFEKLGVQRMIPLIQTHNFDHLLFDVRFLVISCHKQFFSANLSTQQEPELLSHRKKFNTTFDKFCYIYQ